jgi:hypothetical protein
MGGVMATTMSMVSIEGLRATHFEQIMAAVLDNEGRGYYYGNREQYYKRHDEIIEWLDGLIGMARDPDYRIPK